MLLIPSHMHQYAPSSSSVVLLMVNRDCPDSLLILMRSESCRVPEGPIQVSLSGSQVVVVKWQRIDTLLGAVCTILSGSSTIINEPATAIII